LTPGLALPIRTAPPQVRPRLFYFAFRFQRAQALSRRAAKSSAPRITTMKVRSSLKSLKGRHRDCKIVRRKGVVYVINKTDPRFKAKQG